MAQIQPTTSPARWLINATEYSGITSLGEMTGVSNTLDTALIWAEGDAAFLDAANGNVFSFPALPSAGVWCEINSIYAYDGGAVICRLSHNRTEHAPEDTPNLWMVRRTDGGIEWIVGEQVQVGTIRTYGGIEYICLQAHVTQVDWPPPAVQALWAAVVPPSAEWAYPVAYKVADVVTYAGSSYRCLQAHTSNVAWTPTATLNVLWALVT